MACRKIRTRDKFIVSGVKVFQAVCQAYCNQINGKHYVLDAYIPLETEAKEQVFEISLVPYFVKNKVYFTIRFDISQKARNEFSLFDFYFCEILPNSKNIFNLDTTELFMTYEAIISFLESLPNLVIDEDYRYNTFWKLHNVSQPLIWMKDKIKLITINITKDEIENFLLNSSFTKLDLANVQSFSDEISLVPVLSKGKEKLFVELEIRKDFYSSIVARKSLDFSTDSNKVISEIMKKIPWTINFSNLDEMFSCLCNSNKENEESGE